MTEIVDVLGSGEFAVVVVDSITVFTPSKILEKVEKDGISKTIGVKAWLNNRFTELSVLKNRACAFLIINQGRIKIGAKSQVPLPPEPGGGQGLKHYKSISVELGKGSWLGEDGTELGRGSRKKKAGFTVRFKVRKNKTAPPYREGSYRFYFSEWKNGGAGIDTEFDVQRLARMHGVKIAKGRKPTAAQMRKLLTWPEGES